MSFVEKMTLFGDSRSEKEENITPNKEPIKSKKIFPHTLEPPTLRLDTDYGSTLCLKLCEDSNKALYFEANLRYKDSGPSNREDHFGYSANMFPRLNRDLKLMSSEFSRLDGTSIRFYYNLIILGRIHEAACRSGYFMDDVEFDRDMLNSFVNKSLEFYGYHDYNFDCNVVLDKLYINHESYDNHLMGILYIQKEFVIVENKYTLGYTKTSVYLRLSEDDFATLSLMPAIGILNDYREISNTIREVSAWILLSSEGVYVYNQKFLNSQFTPDNKIPDLYFEGKQQITPDNFAQCFKQS